MSVFLLLLPQKIRQPAEGLFRIHDPGRIVWRIDQHRRRFFTQKLLKGFKMDLKGFRIGGNHLQNVSRPFHIRPVFREKGREREDLVSRFCDRAEGVGQRSRSP